MDDRNEVEGGERSDADIATEEFRRRVGSDECNEEAKCAERCDMTIDTKPHIEEPIDEDDEEETPSYLGDDPPIHGQTWACISFATTKLDTFSKIEMQVVMEFLLWLKNNEPYGEDEKEEQAKALNLLMEQPDKTDPNAMQDYRKRLMEEFPKYYGNYIGNHRVAINEIAKGFLGKNHVDRAFKLRGCFKTYKKAETYAKEFLSQKVDGVVPIHICEVGKWLPFNPTVGQSEKNESRQKELDELINGALEEQRKSAQAIEIRRQAAKHYAKKNREEYQRLKEEGNLPDEFKEMSDADVRKIRRLESRIMECSLEEQEEMREDAEKEYARITRKPYYKGIMAHVFDRHKTTTES